MARMRTSADSRERLPEEASFKKSTQLGGEGLESCNKKWRGLPSGEALDPE